MYKVFKFKNMSQAAPYMDAQVFDLKVFRALTL